MNRWLRICLYLLVLAALIWYGKVKNPAVTLPMCMANPQKYDGTMITISTEVIVRQVLADGFTIEQMGWLLPVKGNSKNVQVGDYVALSAIFHAPGWLELKELYIAKGRRWKIIVSTFPLVIVVVALMRHYRFDFSHFYINERRKGANPH